MLEKDNIEQQELAKDGIPSEKEALQNDAGQQVVNEAQAQQSNIEADQQINDVRERFGK